MHPKLKPNEIVKAVQAARRMSMIAVDLKNATDRELEEYEEVRLRQKADAERALAEVSLKMLRRKYPEAGE